MYSCIHVFKYSCIHVFMYSCIHVFKYSSIQVFKYRVYKLVITHQHITNNVKSRDPIGSKKHDFKQVGISIHQCHNCRTITLQDRSSNKNSKPHTTEQQKCVKENV